MREKEIKKYTKLNELAEPNGIVIFGSGEDKSIPIGELRQAFALESNIYNRSFKNISINDAVKLYDECIASLAPETILIHIGDADKHFFTETPATFDNKFRELIAHIKSHNKNCRIAIMSLRNYNNNSQTEQINKHLKYIADSEMCEYCDIANKKLWNPKSTKDAISFIYSIGFVYPLKKRQSLHDIVKILFCYEA